jgi:hypothetical protein
MSTTACASDRVHHGLLAASMTVTYGTMMPLDNDGVMRELRSTPFAFSLHERPICVGRPGAFSMAARSLPLAAMLRVGHGEDDRADKRTDRGAAMSVADVA